MELVILLVGTFIILVTYKAFTSVKVKNISAEMYNAAAKNDVNKFNAIINDKWTKWLIRPYYLNLSKIKFYTLNDDVKQLEALTDSIINSKIRTNEKIGLLNPMFSYFIEKQNKVYASKAFEGLKLCFSNQENGKYLIEELQILMDIYVNPKEKRIKDLLKYISQSEDNDKEIWQYRLVTLYLNLDRKNEANKVLDEIRSTTNDMNAYNSFVAKNLKD